jgi:hypothetical protein
MKGIAKRTSGTGATHARMTRHRSISIVAAALVCLVIAVSASAAPVHTDWSVPVNLGPIVNSASTEQYPALSGDGLSLYLDSDRPGGSGGRDLWVSQRPTVNAAWGVPANLGATINSASSDSGPAFSADGHWMFFHSDRPGGFGRADLYQSYRADIHDDFGWQTPINLGPNVNGVGDDTAPSYFENGGHPQLFFGSARPGVTPLRPNLYVSNLQDDGTWGPAVLILELSSDELEIRPTIRQDGLEIFFHSDRAAGAGGNDLWSATRATVEDEWSTPVNLGAPLNTTAADQHPYLSADATTLFFSSTRSGGVGGADLYVTTREQILPATKDECKKGDWERFGVFENQGDCVSWVATGGKNPPG